MGREPDIPGTPARVEGEEKMTHTVDIRIKAIEFARQRELRAAERAFVEGNATSMAGHLRQASQLLAVIESEPYRTEKIAVAA
jgi:hypothetical protein